MHTVVVSTRPQPVGTTPAPPAAPVLRHVNMQLDSFLANSNADDLRAIVRTLLATGPEGTTSAFTTIARNRIQHTPPRKVHPPSSFFTNTSTTSPAPTPALWETAARARSLFGIGLGFESLPILLTIANATRPLRWELDSPMEDALIVIDGDLAQALQSCREQVANKLVKDKDAARRMLEEVKTVLLEFRREVDAWGGEFPLEKGLMSIESCNFKL